MVARACIAAVTLLPLVAAGGEGGAGRLGAARLGGDPVAVEDGRPAFRIPAGSPLARGEHPRMLLTAADLPLLKRRSADGRIGRYVEVMARRSAGKYASNLERAVLYRLTGRKEYLQAVLDSPKLARPTWLYDWAATIDLVWDEIPPKRRAALSDALTKAVARGGSLYWRPTLHAVSVFYEGGRGPNDAALLTRMKRDFRETLVQWTDKLNRWSAGRGGSDMSHGYNGEHAYWEPFIAAIAWTNSTGEDFLARARFARYQSPFYWYHFLPGRRPLTVEKIGVTRTADDRAAVSPGHCGANNLLYLTFTRTGDGLGLAWMDLLHRQDSRWRKDADAVGRVLWWDPDQKALDANTLPTTRLFPTSGHVVMRSDWTPRATFATFRCGRFGEIDGSWGRNNADNLSFTIRKAGPLAIDSGPVHGQNVSVLKFHTPGALREYGRQSIAHNTITLGDGEFAHVDWRGQPTGDVVRRGGQSVMQDKAWWGQWGFKAPRRDFAEGHVAAYRTGPLYDYALGDARLSYPPAAVREITRQFVYLRPDVFVVYDRIVLPRGAAAARAPCWLLHSLREPKASGAETPLPAERIGKQFVMTADGKRPHDRPGGHVRMGGEAFTIESGSPGKRGPGRLTVRTLWPTADGADRRKIGGRGHDFEVAGIQYGLADEGYQRADDRYAVGSTIGLLGWRVELRHREPGETVEFLHVARASLGPADTGRPSLRSTPDAHVVTVAHAARTFELTLRRTGPRGGSIRIRDTAGRDLHQADLPTTVQDHWRAWHKTPHYRTWVTDPRYRVVIEPTDADRALAEPDKR